MNSGSLTAHGTFYLIKIVYNCNSDFWLKKSGKSKFYSEILVRKPKPKSEAPTDMNMSGTQ